MSKLIPLLALLLLLALLFSPAVCRADDGSRLHNHTNRSHISLSRIDTVICRDSTWVRVQDGRGIGLRLFEDGTGDRIVYQDTLYDGMYLYVISHTICDTIYFDPDWRDAGLTIDSGSVVRCVLVKDDLITVRLPEHLYEKLLYFLEVYDPCVGKCSFFDSSIIWGRCMRCGKVK